MSRRILVLACLAVVVLSGCSVVVDDGGERGDADAISERVGATLDDTETLTATMIATTDVGNETITERVRLRYQRPQHYNLTWIEATNASGQPLGNVTGDAVIANGTQLWAYDDATSRVAWLNGTEPRTLTQLLMPSTQFGDNRTFEGTETVGGEDATRISYAIDGSKVSLISGDLDRRSRLASQMNESTPVEATVWIDRDRWLPIKTRLTVSAFDDDVTITYRYEDIERNVDLPSGSFQPPADATRAPPWAEIEGRLGEHGTLAETNAEAGRPIPSPSVPDGFSFQWGNVSTVEGNERALVFYARDTVGLELARWDNESIDPLRTGQPVSIGPTEGTFVSLAAGQYVEWTCDGYTYLVSTRASEEAALAFARSVGC
jgi:outer membrane lipoprotein-sorting protein